MKNYSWAASILITVTAFSSAMAQSPAQQSAEPVAQAVAEAKQTKFINATPKDIGEVLRYNGYDFKSETYDGKEVLIVDIDGITSVIQFYGKEPEFDSIQLYAGFVAEGTIERGRVNDWNKSSRFTRAYIDNEGDPVLEMDLNFSFGGIAERQLEDWLYLWEISLSSFHQHIYNKSTKGGGK